MRESLLVGVVPPRALRPLRLIPRRQEKTAEGARRTQREIHSDVRFSSGVRSGGLLLTFTSAVCPFRGTVSSKLPTFRVSTRLWSFGQKPLKLIRTLWSGSSRTSTVLSTYLYDPVTLLTAIVFLDC